MKNLVDILVVELLTETTRTLPTVKGKNSTNNVVQGYVTGVHLRGGKKLDFRGVRKGGDTDAVKQMHQHYFVWAF